MKKFILILSVFAVIGIIAFLATKLKPATITTTTTSSETGGVGEFVGDILTVFI